MNVDSSDAGSLGNWYKGFISDFRISAGVVYGSSFSVPTQVMTSTFGTPTFDGFKEMTDAQIKYSLGQRVKSLRATAGAIGSYQLRSSAQGAPIMPGTWMSAGTATNTRRTLVDTAYTRTRNSSYVRSRVSAYTRDRISTYSRNRVDSFSRTFTGNYTGAYSRGFTGNYSRDFTGNYGFVLVSLRLMGHTHVVDYQHTQQTTYVGSRINI